MSSKTYHHHCAECDREFDTHFPGPALCGCTVYQCPYCNRDYQPNKPTQITCMRQECKNAHSRAMENKRKMIRLNGAICKLRGCEELATTASGYCGRAHSIADKIHKKKGSNGGTKKIVITEGDKIPDTVQANKQVLLEKGMHFIDCTVARMRQVLEIMNEQKIDGFRLNLERQLLRDGFDPEQVLELFCAYAQASGSIGKATILLDQVPAFEASQAGATAN